MATPYVKTPFTASPGEIAKLYDGADTPEPWRAHVFRVMTVDDGQWIDVIAETLVGGAIVAYRFRIRGQGSSPQNSAQQALAPVETGPGESHVDVCTHRIYTVDASRPEVNGTWMLLGQSLDSNQLPDLPWRAGGPR
jgi:hypothetical protein